MLLAIPLKKGDMGLGSEVNQHFSRSDFFAIIDISTEEVRLERNPQAKIPGHDGTLSFLEGLGVERIACSGMGTPALLFAQELGMKVCYGRAGTAEEMLSMYKDGILENMVDGTRCRD